MANVIINDTHLTDIANAIRTKKGTVNKIYPKDMATEISGISTGTDTTDATAVAGDILAGKTSYSKGAKVTGTMPVVGTQIREINNKNDSLNISKGYHNGNGYACISDSEKTKLIPQNIKSGVNLLGVNGTYTGTGGINTSDATAVASDIVSGKTAYANGQKITGSLPNNATFTSGKGRISIQSSPDYKASIKFINMRNRACYLPADAEIIIEDDTTLTEYLGNATPDNVLENVTFTSANGGSQIGTIPNKSNSGTVYISNANVITKIPRGYYDGNVRVDIDSNSYRNLYADNIREGVTILGVTGTMKASQPGSVRSANGTTTSQNINTGLNKIDYLFLYTDRISGIGVVNLSFNATKNECSLTFCGDYSVYSKYCNTIIRQPFTVSGGVVNWTETMTEYCFMSGATYNWVAIGS